MDSSSIKLRLYTLLLASLFLGMFLLPQYAESADRYWVGGNGDWNDGSQWSATSGGAGGAGEPMGGDFVYLNQSDNTDRIINYNSTQNNVFNPLISVHSNATGTGSITLNLSNLLLYANIEVIGLSGTGIFNQTVGEFRVTS